MKTVTASRLFEAYERMATWMHYIERNRIRGVTGIAVEQDAEALEWQRYNRAYQRVRRMLREVHAASEQAQPAATGKPEFSVEDVAKEVRA